MKKQKSEGKKRFHETKRFFMVQINGGQNPWKRRASLSLTARAPSKNRKLARGAE
jgi:hypothetical protein